MRDAAGEPFLAAQSTTDIREMPTSKQVIAVCAGLGLGLGLLWWRGRQKQERKKGEEDGASASHPTVHFAPERIPLCVPHFTRFSTVSALRAVTTLCPLHV